MTEGRSIFIQKKSALSWYFIQKKDVPLHVFSSIGKTDKKFQDFVFYG